ncbi:hypothetical protein BLNAU_14006 [Blattamonas nauphoetae]|uniref:Right handed beta helix domain-containing protein n=1 Tax=Blattamonas nauphoetae TaxID=2049346 RepID=A0ABQ9XIK6_9EUKA|nr:hypothetical protein BLNAU_14006 [Blattamonas nauphoetae]
MLLLIHLFFTPVYCNFFTENSIRYRAVSPYGFDEPRCLTDVESPCFSLSYALSTTSQTDLDVSVDVGTYDNFDCLTVSQLKSLVLRCDSSVGALIKTQNQCLNLIFSFKSITSLIIRDLHFQADHAQVFDIIDCDTVEIVGLQYNLCQEGTNNPSSIVSITNCQSFTSDYRQTEDFGKLTVLSSVIFFSISDCHEVTIKGDSKSYISYTAQFLETMNSKDITISELTFQNAFGNMISIESATNVDLTNITFSGPSDGSEIFYKADQSDAIVFIRDVLSHVSITNCVVKSTKFVAIECSDIDHMDFHNSNFTKLLVNLHTVPTAHSDARLLKKERFGGYGFCVTARDVRSLQLAHCTFTASGYHHDKYYEIGGGDVPRLPSAAKEDVVSLVFVQNADSFVITDECFFDDLCFVPSSRSTSFISTAIQVPSHPNLRHTTRRRSGTMIFTENVKAITLDDILVSKVNGSVVALIGAETFEMNRAYINRIIPSTASFAQSPIFCEQQDTTKPPTKIGIHHSSVSESGLNNLIHSSMTLNPRFSPSYAELDLLPRENDVGGGVLHALRADVTITNFSAHDVRTAGNGGVFWVSGGSSLTIDDSEIVSAFAVQNGGSIFCDVPTFSFTDSNVSDCQASIGAVVFGTNKLSSVVITDNNFSVCMSSSGALLSAHLSDAAGTNNDAFEFSRNTVIGSQGIYSQGVELTVHSLPRLFSFDSNSVSLASAEAGGILLDVTVNLDASGNHPTFSIKNTTIKEIDVGLGGALNLVTRHLAQTTWQQQTNADPIFVIDTLSIEDSAILELYHNRKLNGLVALSAENAPDSFQHATITNSNFVQNLATAISASNGVGVTVSKSRFHNNTVRQDIITFVNHFKCSASRLSVKDDNTIVDPSPYPHMICEEECSKLLKDENTCPVWSVSLPRIPTPIVAYPIIPQIIVQVDKFTPVSPALFVSSSTNSVPHKLHPLSNDNPTTAVSQYISLHSSFKNDSSTVLATVQNFTLIGFPKRAPDFVFVRVSPDGNWWSEEFPVVLKVKKSSLGFILAISIPVSVTLLSVVGLVIVLLCVRRSRKKKDELDERKPLLVATNESDE